MTTVRFRSPAPAFAPLRRSYGRQAIFFVKQHCEGCRTKRVTLSHEIWQKIRIPKEAEKILNEYGAVIGSKGKNEIVQDVFSLPYSPGKIRYAHFVYIEALIREGLFNSETEIPLKNTYAMLDGSFVEDSAEINKAWALYKTDENARKVITSRGGFAAILPSAQKMNELHNFIADCYGNWGKK